MRRSFDGARVNYLANHPTIRPHIGGDGKSILDLAPHLRDHNYFLDGEHGGFLCTWTAPDTFECHALILPDGRGKWGFSAAREAMDYMAGIGATHLWGRSRAPQTSLFLRKIGFRPCGTQVLEVEGVRESYDLFNWSS